MDTPMLMQTMSKKLHQSLCLVLPVVFGSYSALAGELTFKPAIKADYYDLSVDFVDEPEQSDVAESVYKVSPSFSGAYDSKKLKVASHIIAEKTTHSEQETHDSSFVTYGLQAKAFLIENLLTLNSSVNKSFRSASTKSGVFNDSVFGSEELVGVTNSNLALNLATSNSNMLQLSGNVQLQRSKADDDIDLADFGSQGISRYDTKSISAGFQANSPANSHVKWDIALAASDSDRSQIQNYQNSSFKGGLTLPVFENFALGVNALVNKNKIDDELSLSNGLAYKQFGAGIRWTFAKQSHLSLMSYRSKSGEQDSRNFIGGEFNWVVSPRTHMMFSANRNQFGEEYGFTLKQASRFVRTQMSYNEGIDIQSRSNFIAVPVGSYICPADVVNPNTVDCYVPEDVNYQPAIGEVPVNFFGRDIELFDVVSRFETGQLSIAYDNQRRIKLSFGVNFSERVSLEDTTGIGASLNRKTIGYSASAAYAISSKTSLAINNSLSRNTYLDSNGDETDRVEDNKMWELKLTSARSSSFNLNVSVSERDSNRAGLAYTDKRVQFGLSYTFE